MTEQPAILLFVGDEAVLSSLQFALSIRGHRALSGADEGVPLSAAAAVVVDQSYRSDGLATIRALRAAGCGAPAILLATNPTARLRERTAAAGVVLIEKPLLGDELASAIDSALISRKAA
ncbi:MAG: histidine kinase [Tsuneonella sp.]